LHGRVCVSARRKLLLVIVIVVAGKAELLEVVLALDAVCRFARPLHGGHQQTNEDGNDGDHHQQFNQGKPLAGQPSPFAGES